MSVDTHQTSSEGQVAQAEHWYRYRPPRTPDLVPCACVRVHVSFVTGVMPVSVPVYLRVTRRSTAVGGGGGVARLLCLVNAWGGGSVLANVE